MTVSALPERPVEAPRREHHRPMLLVVGVLSLLSAVFLSHYSAFIAPHYPNNSDQPDYIWHVYTAYYQGFVTPADAGEMASQVAHLANFKGFVLEALGLLAMLLFGPSRTALAMGNVALFWALGLTLASYFGRLFRPRVGLFAFGLMLFSHGLTMIPGGMGDLRWDFGGLATFGLASLALSRLLLRADLPSLGLFAGSALLTIATRSITGVYLGATMAVVILIIGALALVLRAPFWWLRFRMTCLGGIAVCLVFLAYALPFWRSIRAYYGQILFTEEGKYRLAEAGVSGRFGLVKFYVAQMAVHFDVLAMIATASILIAAVGTAIRLMRRERGGHHGSLDVLRLAVAQIVATLAGVLVPLCLWSPSEVVTGVLTGPIVSFAAVLFGVAEGCGRRGWRRLAAGHCLAVIVLIGGVAHFVLATTSSGIGGADLSIVRQADEGQFRLAEDLRPIGGHVVWALVTDWAGLNVFDIFLYEHGLSDLVPTMTGGPLGIFAVDQNTVLTQLAGADAVFVNTAARPASETTYPLVGSLQHSRDVWQPVLDRDFVLRKEIPLGNGEVAGLYVRPVRLRAITRADATFTDKHAAFALSDTPVLIHLTNFAADARLFSLAASAMPGPDAEDQDRSVLEISYEGRIVEAAGTEQGGWAIRQTFVAPPGDSTIAITVAAHPSPTLPDHVAPTLAYVDDFTLSTKPTP